MGLRWLLGAPDLGHDREDNEEYKLADRIRVSSPWAKASMVQHGVPAEKIAVIHATDRFDAFQASRAAPVRDRPDSLLRRLYGLARAFSIYSEPRTALAPRRVRVTFVGGTGDRGCKQLLHRERMGLDVIVAWGTRCPVYHNSELFVLPSLEDGYGFVTAEALACGLPVVVARPVRLCRPGPTWRKRLDYSGAGQSCALANVLEEAWSMRSSLPEMGEKVARVSSKNSNARASATTRGLVSWGSNSCDEHPVRLLTERPQPLFAHLMRTTLRQSSAGGPSALGILGDYPTRASAQHGPVRQRCSHRRKWSSDLQM